jgi:calcineurin-like phosphoesterase family protein
MIKIDKDRKVWITSDTHFGHKNICRGVTGWRTADDKIPISQTRDFKDLGHMNDTIVNNINSIVGQDDILIHLGDWSFGGFDSIKEFRDRIACQNICLAYGNHDHHIENNREDIQSIFTHTFQYTVLEVSRPTFKTIAGWKHEFVIDHYPLASWHDMNKGRFHLFGHVHLPPNQKLMGGRSMDVGMDGNNLIPYELKEVVAILENRPIKTTLIESDHHEQEVK